MYPLPAKSATATTTSTLAERKQWAYKNNGEEKLWWQNNGNSIAQAQLCVVRWYLYVYKTVSCWFFRVEWDRDSKSNETAKETWIQLKWILLYFIEIEIYWSLCPMNTAKYWTKKFVRSFVLLFSVGLGQYRIRTHTHFPFWLKMENSLRLNAIERDNQNDFQM